MISEVQDLVAHVVGLAIEQRQPVSRVIDADLIRGVNGDARAELIRQGLIYLGTNELHRWQKANGNGAARGPAIATPDGAGAVRQIGHPHPRDEVDVLRRVMLATSNGEQYLPVLEMPVHEIRAAVNECRSYAAGWKARADALAFAATSCEQAGVEMLAQLTPKKLAIVRAHFEKTWGAA